MSTCPTCRRPVIRGLLGGQIEVVMDPGPRVFATVEAFLDDPEDGVRVFGTSNNYVEHSAVCPGQPAALPTTIPEPARGVSTRQRAKKGA